MMISRCTDGIPSEIKLKPYEGELHVDIIPYKLFSDPHMLSAKIS